MDYDRLYEKLPKYSITWTIDDIETWLTFIGLTQFIPEFKNASIDGSILSELTEEDFRNELKIDSKILLKKIMTWINTGIKNYDAYLKEKQALTSSKTLVGKRATRPTKVEIQEEHAFDNYYPIQGNQSSQHQPQSQIKPRPQQSSPYMGESHSQQKLAYHQPLLKEEEIKPQNNPNYMMEQQRYLYQQNANQQQQQEYDDGSSFSNRKSKKRQQFYLSTIGSGTRKTSTS